ncbi:hypothetical protein [Streptomyces sp. bgisy100]|uniref:hypothetical protein n=1 Tax=Streptomyces sp. bgisy100 TaxID=3413783 RepID=UPI003D745759
MTEEVIPFGRNQPGIRAVIPDALPGSLPRGAVVAAIAAGAGGVARGVAAVRHAVVRVVGESNVQIQYLDEHHRVLREDIVPVMAMIDAHQNGRDAARAAGLDPDLLEEALADMDKRRRRRRGGV